MCPECKSKNVLFTKKQTLSGAAFVAQDGTKRKLKKMLLNKKAVKQAFHDRGKRVSIVEVKKRIDATRPSYKGK